MKRIITWARFMTGLEIMNGPFHISRLRIEYKKRNAPFNPQRHYELIDEIIADYTRDRIRHAPHSGLATERPVFVLGMPRSGTTLVEQILCSHPQVYGGGELQDLQWIAADMDSRSDANLVRPPLLRI